MDKNTLPIKWILGGVVILSMIVYGMFQPSKKNPLSHRSSSAGAAQQHAANDQSTNTSTNTSTATGTINAIRTNAEVLQAIAHLNENHDKINALLASNAALAAQVRQQANASRYQTASSKSLPGPNTDPAPADLLAKLKSNQLMHH